MRLRLGLIVGALLCLAALPSAQQPSSSQPKFRAGVDVVELDVSVLDKNREPIHDLTAADFTIRENSKPQTIVAFNPVNIPEASPAPETPWLREIAPDVRRNDEVKDPRIFVIVLDDAMVVPDPWILASTKRIARQVIDQLGPSDLAAVTFTSAGISAQELTNDHARLLAAVDRFDVGLHDVAPVSRISEEIHYLAPLRTLQSIAEALINAPQSRKVLVYVSSGIPIDYASAAIKMTRSEVIPAPPGQKPSFMLTPDLAIGEMQKRLMDNMKLVFTQARLANVNVYCLDSAGLDGLDGYIAMQSGMQRPVPSYETGDNYRNFSLTMADNTGGLAVIGTNDFAPGIAQLFKENGSYYVIGYQSTDTRRDGSYRRVQIDVNRPGAIVRAKSGYYAEKVLTGKHAATAAAQADPAQPLASAVPRNDIPLQVTASAFASSNWREPRTAAVAILLGLRRAANAGADGIDAMDVVFSAFTTQQTLQATRSIHLASSMPGGPPGEIAYEFGTQLDLPPGRYMLRVGARRTRDGKSGTVHTDVDVPDFTQPGVSLSGVVLTASPGVSNPAPLRLQALLPVTPTSLRDFVSTDRVNAFVRAYNRAGTSVPPGQMTLRIVDQHGATVFEESRPVVADGFNLTGAADYSVPLPIDRLSAGQYLLTVEATIGTMSARRDVRFQVR